MLRSDKIAWSDFGRAKRARRANNRMLFVKWLASLRFISAAQHPVVQRSGLRLVVQVNVDAPVSLAFLFDFADSNRTDFRR